ncbi:hypothetical protein, partial [Streptomyces acidiscabies]|uniref:hypothetical protein n=1 Tax=Streptomyces acidiscabies TaxID=42234 RepID=UPI001F247868
GCGGCGVGKVQVAGVVRVVWRVAGSGVDRRGWGVRLSGECGYVVACRAHAAEPHIDTAPRP